MSIPYLSQAIQRIEPSRTTAMTDRATELREQGKDIISLSVGEPDFPTPPIWSWRSMPGRPSTHRSPERCG